MKLLSSILLTVFTLLCLAQSAKHEPIKKPTLLFHLSSFDFKTAPAIAQTSLGDVLKNNQWSSLKDNYSGFGVSYQQGILKTIDVAASLHTVKMFYGFRNQLYYGERGQLYELDVALNFKLLTDDHLVVPFLSAGIGGYHFKKTNGSYAPLGAGFNVNLKNRVSLHTSFEYCMPVTTEAQHHFIYNLSVGVPINKKEKRKTDITSKPYSKPADKIVGILNATRSNTDSTDTDEDGVPDTIDKCPTVKGPASNSGCPLPIDSDNDGVIDSLDKCPNVPGLISYDGCPLPDGDGDGVPDVVDKCPDAKGTLKYRGCPIPDSDGDGVNDEIDKCPTEKGLASNNGCPAVAAKIDTSLVKKPAGKVSATYKVYFTTGESSLTPSIYNVLNGIGEILETSFYLKARIVGHHDNGEISIDTKSIGQKRADEVTRYLISLGIDKSRLTTISEAPAKPKGSDQTMTSRSVNRRVDIIITNY